MVRGIETGDLQQEVLRAALQASAQSQRVDRASAELFEAARALRGQAPSLEESGANPARELLQGASRAASGAAHASEPQGLFAGEAKALAARVQQSDAIPSELLAGRIESLPELAVSLKTTELSLRFALEVRNKLIEAYREVMRMSV
jgi:flagellar hook-basal body complex protein FliE